MYFLFDIKIWITYDIKYTCYVVKYSFKMTLEDLKIILICQLWVIFNVILFKQLIKLPLSGNLNINIVSEVYEVLYVIFSLLVNALVLLNLRFNKNIS